MSNIFIWSGFILGTTALLYLAVCTFATRAWFKRRTATAISTPPVTILKPLCGMEPGLYDNLRSFCTQDYPEFQIIFGSQSADDPALDVARTLQHEFPHLDIQIVCEHSIQCGNFKVANLMQMEPYVAFEHLVISDSDIRVGNDYLHHLAGELDQPDAGVVTCLYRGLPAATIWSRLGALHINEWFLPSVLTGRLLGLNDFGFGATLALRRQSLERIGGFKVLADQLADDYMLAKLLREHGLKTVLSDYLVETTVHEPSFASLWQHELRWMRTVRMLQPAGHAFSCMTHTLPATLVAAALAHAHPWAWAMPATAIVLRIIMHRISLHDPESSLWLDLLLLPIRDLLTFAVWAGSYASRHVRWRGRRFAVRRDGYMLELGEERF